MNFSKKHEDPTRKYLGIGIVILLHVGVVYALMNGLARKVVEIVQAPMETKIIEELKKLPPPPPPPPKPKPEPKPQPQPEIKKLPPPPAYVPPAEVPVQAPVAAPSITTTTVAPPPEPPPAPKEPVFVAPVINAAQSCRKPTYPSVSRRNEEQGTVILRFLIAPDGNVVRSEVKSSSGFDRLDEAARKALSLCNFKPGTLDGTPTESWAEMRYVWRLE